VTFIETQRDFLEFVSLFSFVICALECVVLNREERSRRWQAYFGFFVLQSLASAWLMVSPAFTTWPAATFMAPLFQSVGFGSLLAFSTGLGLPSRVTRRSILLSVLVLAAVDTAGVFLGHRIFSLIVGLVFAVPGAVFAVRFLLSDPSIRKEGRPWLVAHAWTLVGLCVVMTARSAAAVLFPRSTVGYGPVLQPLLALAVAFTLSIHGWRSFIRANRGYGRTLTRLAIYGSNLALPLILLTAGLVTEALGSRALGELRTTYSKDAEDVSAKISSLTGEIDHDVQLIGSSPRAAPFILNRGSGDRTGLGDFLERVSRQIKANCYIFDSQGRPRATSGNASDSYLSISGANAPIIRDALAGGYGRYFMVNEHTHAREYYSSAPISDPVEGIVGVAVIQQNIESIFPDVDPGAEAFLVDGNGIVFFSNAHDLAYRALWPIPIAEQDAARADGRYGYVSFVPVLSAKPADGEVISRDGTLRLANRAYLYVPGWSIVHLGPVREVLFYRLAGLLAALVATIVFVAFSAASQMSLLDEGRVERSEGMYRAVVEGSPDWISTVDADGAFQYVNTAGRTSLGMESSAAPATIHEVLGGENMALLAGRVEVALHGGIVSSEELLPSASGEVKVWRITLVPLKETTQGRNVILIGNDITDTRRAEARLLRAERLAAVGTLAAGVAHQFNNINAVALGYIQVLEADPALSVNGRQYIHSIRDALERSVQITTRLLPLSAPESGVTTLFLAKAVRAALPSLQPDLDREGATLDLDLDETASVLINPEQLDFVVVTLLVNACHAVMGQPVRNIKVSTGVEGGQAFLRVQDSGIGIAQGKLSSIFTPFFTEKGEHAAPQSPQARVQGVGLSLSVVNSIVAARDGRIEIESTPGGGSTFTVWMPRG
jgi:PAS domain S-box-containing protein